MKYLRQCVIIGKFIIFLKHYGIYEKFLYNVKNRPSTRIQRITLNKFLLVTNPPSFINFAFAWRNTDEKWDFWHDFNNKWVEFYANLLPISKHEKERKIRAWSID